jgi:hypothetical protein
MRVIEKSAIRKPGEVTEISGLTKREHFAALAMQGMLANPELMNHVNGFPDPVNIISYVDELLKRLDS